MISDVAGKTRKIIKALKTMAVDVPLVNTEEVCFSPNSVQISALEDTLAAMQDHVDRTCLWTALQRAICTAKLCYVSIS